VANAAWIPADGLAAMRAIVTIEFTQASPLTPEGFRKWLQVNLSEHLEAEHKWDEGTCPPLRGVEVELSLTPKDHGARIARKRSTLMKRLAERGD
jgi:hypothetical protein